MSLKALRSGRIQYTSEDSSREFISLLIYISANNMVLSLVPIYKGNSLSLQDTWLKN